MQHTSKLLFTLLVSLSFVCPAHSQTTELLITASAYDKLELFESDKDAARLALRYNADGDKLLDFEIEIPENIHKSLFNALMAVRNSPDKEAQLVTKLNIHTHQKPFYIDQFTVVCDKQTDWTTPLAIGDPHTTNEEVNALIEKYNLSISDYDEENNSFTVSAYPYINMSALAVLFSEIEGVHISAVPAVNGQDTDIIAEHLGHDSWKITYIKYQKNEVTRCKDEEGRWSFIVETDGSVKYLIP